MNIPGSSGSVVNLMETEEYEYRLYVGYARQLMKRIYLCVLVTAALLGCFLDSRILASPFWAIVVLSLFLLSIVYSFSLILKFRNKVKCPHCHRICAPYSSSYRKERRVLCPDCRIVWQLGYCGLFGLSASIGGGIGCVGDGDGGDGDGGDGD